MDFEIIKDIFEIAVMMVTVIGSNKLTAYRIEQLEKKVDKHNNVVERTYEIEKRLEVDENRIKVSEHRLEDLERSERGGGNADG